MTELKVGDKAPLFTAAVTPDGEVLSLSELRPNPVVLYFYPRDNTPGCTIENIEFTGLAEKFEELGVKLYGISRDTLKKHLNFQAKQSLTIPLIADPDESVCELYDVMREKNMYGKKVRGIERSTFIIDGKGVLAHIRRKVNVNGHADETLAKCQELFS